MSKSTMPLPPPFYQLYSFPPPPPPPSVAPSAVERANARKMASGHAAARLLLPLDIYQPPPPPQEAFIKFGEIQPVGYMSHEIGQDVPHLFSTSSPISATTSPDGLPALPAMNYTASLRMLNRQYLQAYLEVLSNLTADSLSSSSSSAPADLSSSSSEGGSRVQQALKRLSDIGANMSWILTQLRPHQALQTIVQLIMKQTDKRKKKTAQVKSSIAEAKAFLAAHGVHYANGSTNIIPDATLPATKVKEEDDHMDITTTTAAQVDQSPAADLPSTQLLSFLDAIEDE